MILAAGVQRVGLPKEGGREGVRERGEGEVGKKNAKKFNIYKLKFIAAKNRKSEL